MKIEEYISSLPESIITGEQIQLLDDSIRDVFRMAGLGHDDIFYHLGCGTGNGIAIALKEFGVKKAVGIDSDVDKILQAEEVAKLENSEFRCQDILESDISDASVILFWFSDTKIIESMLEKFTKLKNCRVITIFDPLPGLLPDRVDFPYL
ncbi:MAG TPA: methyltransferase domain-containing protein, partial [Candidatus Nitrosotenuis sp.]|nr:methyltransferase domain-containing protein [Candidatus Nitrosotenuis sp.]